MLEDILIVLGDFLDHATIPSHSNTVSSTSIDYNYNKEDNQDKGQNQDQDKEKGKQDKRRFVPAFFFDKLQNFISNARVGGVGGVAQGLQGPDMGSSVSDMYEEKHDKSDRHSLGSRGRGGGSEETGPGSGPGSGFLFKSVYESLSVYNRPIYMYPHPSQVRTYVLYCTICDDVAVNDS